MKSKIAIIFTSLLITFSLIPQYSTKASTQVFSDVPTNHSNYGDIMYLLEKDVIEPGEKYGVKAIVTREEVAVMVAKAVGLDGKQRATKFSDVPKSNPNSGYIQSAVEAGIISGFPNGTFKPTQKVTRGHMAAFIARAFKLPVGTKTFKDVPKRHTAYVPVKQLAKAGITYGYADGTFKPANNLTRAHISAFIARAIQFSKGELVITDQPTGKVYPDGWVAPVLESSWTPNHKTNLKILQSELGFINDGMTYGIPEYREAMNVIGQSPDSPTEVDLTWLFWTDKNFATSYRIPIVSKELFKFYFEEDADRVWNYFNNNDIPEQFTANGRKVKAGYDTTTGTLYLQVGRK